MLPTPPIIPYNSSVDYQLKSFVYWTSSHYYFSILAIYSSALNLSVYFTSFNLFSPPFFLSFSIHLAFLYISFSHTSFCKLRMYLPFLSFNHSIISQLHNQCFLRINLFYPVHFLLPVCTILLRIYSTSGWGWWSQHASQLNALMLDVNAFYWMCVHLYNILTVCSGFCESWGCYVKYSVCLCNWMDLNGVGSFDHLVYGYCSVLLDIGHFVKRVLDCRSLWITLQSLSDHSLLHPQNLPVFIWQLAHQCDRIEIVCHNWIWEMAELFLNIPTHIVHL